MPESVRTDQLRKRGETFLRIFASAMGLFSILVLHRYSMATLFFTGVIASIADEIMVNRGASDRHRRRLKIAIAVGLLSVAAALLWRELARP